MKLSDLGSSLRELDILSQAVAEYFCEEPAIFKLEDSCSVFHSFCQRFLTAIQVSLPSALQGWLFFPFMKYFGTPGLV